MRHFLLLLAIITTANLQAQTLRWNSAPAQTTAKSITNSLTEQQVETGEALYYADYLHGQPTAMGEVYNKNLMTGAHKTLPFGAIVKITRTDNGKSVTVRINDRGPYCDGCLIDLSYVAAREIDLLRAGRAQVVLQLLGYSNENPESPVQNNNFVARTPQQQQQPSNYNYQPNNYSYQQDLQQRQQQLQNLQTRGTQAPARSSYQPNIPNQIQPYQNQTQQYQTQQYQNQVQPVQSYNTYQQNIPNQLQARGVQVQPSNYNQVNADRIPATTSPRSVPVQTAKRADDVHVLSNAIEGFAVQLGSYGEFSNAERQVVALQRKGFDNIFVLKEQTNSGLNLNRVIVAPFTSITEAQNYLADLREYYQMEGIVVQIK